MEKVTISKIVMPPVENHRGQLFGGALLAWMDETAGIAAMRYAGTEVATVAVKEVRFLKPIPGGALADVTAQVTEVGNSSIQVKLEVMSQNHPDQEKRVLAADAVFVCVAMDENGNPVKAGR